MQPKFPRWAEKVTSWLSDLIKWLLGLRIDDFQPREGWPGTIITIVGHGFSADRDSNRVFIGTERALLLDASDTQIVALAGEGTATAALRVEVGADSFTSGAFQVLPTPNAIDITLAGPPRFFHGPQPGTPHTNVQHQPVLVIPVFPTDQDPGDAATRAALRATEIASYDNARLYWEQASFGSTTWDMTYADWIALPQDWRFYFWGQADIEDARRRLLDITCRAIDRSGSSIIHGVSPGWIPIDHSTPLNWSFLLGQNPDGSKVTALKRIGNLLFAGTTGGGLFLYDVTDPGAATLRGSVQAGVTHGSAGSYSSSSRNSVQPP